MSTVNNNSSNSATISNELLRAALQKSVDDIEYVCGDSDQGALTRVRNGLIFMTIQLIVLAGIALVWWLMTPGAVLYVLTTVCVGFLLSTNLVGINLAIDGARTYTRAGLFAQATQEYDAPMPDFNAEQLQAIDRVFGNYDQATHGPWKMRLLCHNISLFQQQATPKA